MNYISLVPTFFTWWYGRGLRDLISFLAGLLSYTKNMFSVSVLLKTLFSPWKKMVGARRPGLDGLKDWLADNLISRGIGLVVRIFMLLVFLVFLIVMLVASALVFIFWLGMPAAIIGAFIYIFIGI